MNHDALPDEHTLYEAVVNRDKSLEGVFYFGVKTTGIFCRPGCSARSPKRENVEYFKSVPGALDNGYRPCKICTPLVNSGQTPGWLRNLLEAVHSNPQDVIRDIDLRSSGLDPTRVRRWFVRHYGMTFHAYCRALRVNYAFEKLKNCKPVTTVALDSGYGSLSGFHQAFKNITGFSPKHSAQNTRVYFTNISTPLGPMYAAASDRGVCLLEFHDRKQIDTQIAQLRSGLDAFFINGENPHLQALEAQLAEYFAGRRQIFELPLDMSGTKFQLQAWRTLQTIPFGETRSYRQQARAIGNEKAVRAVASANAKNRIAIVIPCHRVIAMNGDLAGFGGGVWRKKYLLDLEARRHLPTDSAFERAL